jgi:hypothetical protein
VEKQITKSLGGLPVRSVYCFPKEISSQTKKIYFVNSYYHSPLEISDVAKKNCFISFCFWIYHHQKSKEPEAARERVSSLLEKLKNKNTA